MKIVIVGYGEMLKALITGVLNTKHELVGVFRQDRVLKNKFLLPIYDLLKPSDDYNFIKNLKLNEIKATSVNSDEFRDELIRLKVDLLIVGSWSQKFSMQTINIPKIASINVHPSLLPKYRGPNPYLQAIINNEETTGVTFHVMDVNYDTGSIVHQAKTAILPVDNGQSLKLRCCDLAQKEVQVMLNNFKVKYQNRVSQDEKNATYYNHIQLGDCILDFVNLTSEDIDRKIRAFLPWNRCYIPYHNHFFKFGNYKIYSKKSKKDAASITKKDLKSLYIVCADQKVIGFYNVQFELPFSKKLSEIYIKKCVKVNSKAI